MASEDDGTFRSVDELRELYRAEGITGEWTEWGNLVGADIEAGPRGAAA